MSIRSLGVVLATVVALGCALPAFAASSYYYGSATAPIKAENNSDDGNAWFYGAGSVYNGTHLKNRYWYKDSAPGGNKAYVTTDWYYWRTCTDGTTCFDGDGSDRSAEYNDAVWHLGEDYDALDPRSSTGRGGTRVCENQNNSPDACSAYVPFTLTY